MDADHPKYVLCVGRCYYCVHPDSPVPPQFLPGQIVRAACTNINDYQIGGFLKRGRFMIDVVRRPTPVEHAGLCLDDETAPDVRIVEMHRYSSRRAPTTLWPALRLVYYWQWRSPRKKK